VEETRINSKQFLPVDVIFHANWWNKNYGIKFDRGFFFDPVRRVESELRMRQILHERFGDMGLGEEDAVARPVIGPVNLSTCFITSAMFGCHVKFYDDAPPEVIPANMNDEQIKSLEVPAIEKSPLSKELVEMMDVLEQKYGYLEGDVGWYGLQNEALSLRGQQLFMDYYDNPELVRRLFDVVVRSQVEFVSYMKKRTHTSSISLNRIIGKVDSTINLHTNCTVAMISNETYEEYLLPYENYLSVRLQPYGIHHCGDNMHHVLEGYSKVEGASFFDVGWGSDVKMCRDRLPDKVLSIRLSPVKIRTCTPKEVEDDLVRLIESARPLERVAVCCVNMDYGTPDENIRKIFEVADRYRHYGA
jgi:hypothetical protein